MKPLTVFLFLMLAQLGWAQNDEEAVDFAVNQKLAELEMQGNPLYFTLKEYCIGNVQMFTMPDGSLCSSKSTYYSVSVFWKEDEKFKLQKFDNCGSFRPVSLELNKKILQVLKNSHALQEGEVKPYEGTREEKNAFGNMSVQSCHKKYRFVLNGKNIEKSFTEYDLSNDSKFPNVNAAYNNALPLVELDKEISELLKNLETKGRFFREKQ